VPDRAEIEEIPTVTLFMAENGIIPNTITITSAQIIEVYVPFYAGANLLCITVINRKHVPKETLAIAQVTGPRDAYVAT
jgi:hypothetical protein